MNIEIYITIGIIIGLLFVGFLKRYLFTDKTEWIDEAIGILRNIEQGLNTDPRYKIVEYDKLMEFVMQSKCKNKKSLGYNLKNKGSRIFEKEELNQLWKLHKIRNEIVHSNRQSFSKNDLEWSNNQYSIMLKKILFR